MPIDMHSKNTFLGLAALWGVSNALQELVLGAGLAKFLIYLVGSAVVGSLLTMGMAWVVLAIIKKKHLLYAVTNWFLLVGSGLSLILATIATL